MLIKLPTRRSARLASLGLLLFLQVCRARIELAPNPKCADDDLDSAGFVECNRTNCPTWNELTRAAPPLLIANNGVFSQSVLHIESTRSGSRFQPTTLTKIDRLETEWEKSFDINTTLFVSTFVLPRPEFRGFGVDLELRELERSLLKDELGMGALKLLLRDLFANDSFGLAFNSARLDGDYMINQTQSPTLLSDLDSILTEASGRSEKISTLVDLSKAGVFNHPDSEIYIGTMFSSLQTLKLDLFEELDENSGKIHKLYSIDTASGNNKTYSSEIALDWQDGDSYSLADSPGPMTTLLDCVSSNGHDAAGSWQYGQDLAVKILNSLKHNLSRIILRRASLADLHMSPSAAGPGPLTSSRLLYNLQESNGLHLRGPEYYAVAHFSRFITPGSKVLETRLFSQPNMFAAHFLAVLRPDHRVVVIAINGNEHPMPFKVAIDGFIMVQADLKPKSFNTLVIEQDSPRA